MQCRAARAQRASRFVGSHYCEEFAEAHGKVMVVRGALSAGLPAAGVGCAFARDILARLARQAGGGAIFSRVADRGLRTGFAHQDGGRSRFQGASEDGQLVATRASAPGLRLRCARRAAGFTASRCKGWDRLGGTAAGERGWAARPARAAERARAVHRLRCLSSALCCWLPTRWACEIANGPWLACCWPPTSSFAWRAVRFASPHE